MSITLHEIEKNNICGEIRENKFSSLYEVLITEYGKTIYRNTFANIKNAKQALKRNMK